MTGEIEQRRAALLQRCARQREQICRELGSIEDQLGGIESGIRIVQGLATLPGLLISGSLIAVLALRGRGQTLKAISAGVALWATAHRLWRARSWLDILSAPEPRSAASRGSSRR
jgi:hypothetical protein